MIDVRPVTLERGAIRLEPLSDEHHDELTAAAADGRLWELWFTTVPAPEGMRAYVTTALQGQRDGHNQEIAERLDVTANTVKTHLRCIYRKLDAENRRAAVRRAHELNLLNA
jgi:hypothetical protein